MKSKAKQIQFLLTTYLLRFGHIKLNLPDEVSVEIDITKDIKKGTTIADDYCSVQVSRQGNAALLDTYKAELQCRDRENAFIYEDVTLDENGRKIKRLEYV